MGQRRTCGRPERELHGFVGAAGKLEYSVCFRTFLYRHKE